MRVLVVESNPDRYCREMEARGDLPYGAMFRALIGRLAPEAEVEVVCPYEGEAADPRGADGVIFTGSSVPWATDDARAKPLADVMETTFAARVPSYGSCNGMQLAATVLGGRVGASPNGYEGGVARDVVLTDAGRAHPMMVGRAERYTALSIHRDEVQELPEGAAHLGGNDHSPVQAFAHDGVGFWGVQYHPECTPGFIAGVMGVRGAWDAERVGTLSRADRDEDAAGAFGTTVAEMSEDQRSREIQNWLNHVRVSL